MSLTNSLGYVDFPGRVYALMGNDKALVWSMRLNRPVIAKGTNIMVDADATHQQLIESCFRNDIIGPMYDVMHPINDIPLARNSIVKIKKTGKLGCVHAVSNGNSRFGGTSFCVALSERKCAEIVMWNGGLHVFDGPLDKTWFKREELEIIPNENQIEGKLVWVSSRMVEFIQSPKTFISRYNITLQQSNM